MTKRKPSQLDRLFPPPPSVCWRALECLIVLLDEYPDRLAGDRGGGDARRVLQSGPGHLTWRQIRSTFPLFSRLVEMRS